MTNIVASIVVSIVTNTVSLPNKIAVVSIFGKHPTETLVQDGDSIYPAHWEDDPNPTIKTNVTACKEITTLKFDWNGPREITSEKVLWETNVVLKLEWK